MDFELSNFPEIIILLYGSRKIDQEMVSKIYEVFRKNFDNKIKITVVKDYINWTFNLHRQCYIILITSYYNLQSVEQFSKTIADKVLGRPKTARLVHSEIRIRDMLENVRHYWDRSQGTQTPFILVTNADEAMVDQEEVKKLIIKHGGFDARTIFVTLDNLETMIKIVCVIIRSYIEI